MEDIYFCMLIHKICNCKYKGPSPVHKKWISASSYSLKQEKRAVSPSLCFIFPERYPNKSFLPSPTSLKRLMAAGFDIITNGSSLQKQPAKMNIIPQKQRITLKNCQQCALIHTPGITVPLTGVMAVTDRWKAKQERKKKWDVIRLHHKIQDKCVTMTKMHSNLRQ